MPVARADARLRIGSESLIQLRRRVDCRIKSGNDACENETKARRRNAGRRRVFKSAAAAAGAPRRGGLRRPSAAGCARLPAFHRGSSRKRHDASVQLQAMLAAAGRHGYSAKWALPTPAAPQSSEHLTAGPKCRRLMPKAARGRFVTPPAGTAPAPAFRSTSQRRPCRAGLIRGRCNLFRDRCQATSCLR